MTQNGNAAMTLVSMTLIFLLIGRADATKFLVPAYWGAYKPNACTSTSINGAWSTMSAGGSSVVAILNPNSGPDYSGTDATIKCMPFLNKANVSSIGYVATGYGTRPAADIKRDITQYVQTLQAAGMSGIFFDEGTSWWETTAAQISFYADIAQFARNSGFGYLVINPGGRFPPQFLQIFDTVVGYESPAGKWKSGNYHGVCPSPSFATSGDAGYCIGPQNCDMYGGNCVQAKSGQVAAIAFCQSSTGMLTAVQQAQQAGYGAVFLTDQGCRNRNPYAALPSYWSNEMTSVTAA